jgi:polar amino acid transport system substrate-binding protein
MIMNHTNGHERRRSQWLRNALIGSLLCLAAAAPALAAGTLDKARDSGKLSFGYRTDTRPFSYTDESGKAAGYSVALCQKVADAVKADLKLPALAVEFVPVTAANRFDALQQGQIDLLCGTATPTLERRASVDFSIPMFSAGVGAVVRIDTATRLRDALAGRPEAARPIWRAAPGELTEKVVFAVVGGTTIERSLIEALKVRRIEVTVAPVADYASGLRMVLDRRAAALFGDRPVLLDAAKRGPAAGELLVIERSFTRESLALALRRGDDDFRLVVDRSLSRLFRSKEIGPLYTSYFGAPDVGTLEFFKSVALPD